MTRRSAAPHPRRTLSLLSILIILVATPATLALTYYRITGDPTFRPLAVTLERLVAGGIEVNQKAIRAIIVSDNNPNGLARAVRLGQGVHAAFRSKGMEALIVYKTDGTDVSPTVVFFVGHARFGPFTAGTAAHGVSAAAEAVHLSRRNGEAGRDHVW